MINDYENEVKLFMIFDILGDTVRRGPLLWHVKRKRIEDVKNHILDLLLIIRILRRHFPTNIDFNKIYDYIICHDLPEAITGDITKFEGVSEDEREKVTKIAIKYLEDKFNSILDLGVMLNNYEKRIDIESKIVNMIDKVHAATTFIKYQSESNIDVNNPKIIPELKSNIFIKERISEGKDLGDILYEYHIRSVNISEDEMKKYQISKNDADKIVNVIKAFAYEIYSQKKNKTLLNVKNDFPKLAMKYNKIRLK